MDLLAGFGRMMVVLLLTDKFSAFSSELSGFFASSEESVGHIAVS